MYKQNKKKIIIFSFYLSHRINLLILECKFKTLILHNWILKIGVLSF